VKRGENILLTIVLLSIAGCASKTLEDHYYSLVLAADGGVPAAEIGETTGQLLIAPIMLSDYLDQPGLVIQLGSNKLQTANHHFWAEPLREAISKVLVQDIAAKNRTLAVDREHGGRGPHASCYLNVEFDTFHATDGARVVSRGRFWLVSDDRRVRQEFDLSGELHADGYGHAVDALRSLLSSVADEVSRSIESNKLCGVGPAS
jgi:uncharacterized lipoprotein YmbA